MAPSAVATPAALRELLELADSGRLERLPDLVGGMHPSDIADLLASVPDEERQLLILKALPTDVGSETLAEMEEDEDRADLLTALSARRKPSQPHRLPRKPESAAGRGLAAAAGPPAAAETRLPAPPGGRNRPNLCPLENQATCSAGTSPRHALEARRERASVGGLSSGYRGTRGGATAPSQRRCQSATCSGRPSGMGCGSPATGPPPPSGHVWRSASYTTSL